MPLVFYVIIVVLATFFAKSEQVKSSVRAPASHNCSVNLTTESDHCFIPNNELDCYVMKAVEFAQNTNAHLPIWVLTCSFNVPEVFLHHRNDFSCSINSTFGLVDCDLSTNATISTKVESFHRRCLHGLFLLKNLYFPKNYYRNKFFAGGKCERYYDELVRTNEVIAVSERYLSAINISFSSKDEWQLLRKQNDSSTWPTATSSSTWTTAKSIMIVLVLIAVCLLAFIAVVVKRKYFTFKLEGDSTVQQIETVLEFESNLNVDQNSYQETPYPLERTT